MKTISIIPIVVVFSSWMGNSLAQPAGEVKSITRLTGNVLLDGIVDEAGWSLVDPLPLTMHWPVFKGAVTESSEIRVAYDDENIYVGAICYDKDPETSTLALESRWVWKRGSGLTVKVENLSDNVPALFNLSDADTITPGRYSNTILGITHISVPAGMFQAETNVKAGTFYGGNLGSISLSARVIFSKYFEMLAFYEYSHIKFPERDDPFASHVARLNMTTSLNVKLSLSGFVQLNSLQELSSLNFRLRYNPIDGNDLYLVYNEVLNNQQSLRNNPLSDSRIIMVKYIHTFRL